MCALKTFRFRLQQVLEYKERREEEEMRELARLKEIQRREEEYLAHLKHVKESKTLELVEKSAQGVLDVNEIQMYHRFLKKMERLIADQQIKLQQIAVEVEEQRLKLLEASKEKKIYEKLKEKHYEEFLREEEEEERKLVDEIATTGYARNGGYARGTLSSLEPASQARAYPGKDEAGSVESELT